MAGGVGRSIEHRTFINNYYGYIKVIIISFFLAIFFINRKCKKNKEERLRQNRIADKNCYNDTIIKPHDEGYLL